MKNLFNSASAASAEAKFIFQNNKPQNNKQDLAKSPSASEKNEALINEAAGNDNMITKKEYDNTFKDITDMPFIPFSEVEKYAEPTDLVNEAMPTEGFVKAHKNLRISKKKIAKLEGMGLKKGIDKSDEGRKAIKDAMANGTLPKLGANQMMIEDSVVFVDSDGGLRIEANTGKGYSPGSERGIKTNVMTLKKSTTDNKYYWNKSSNKSILN